LGGMGVEIVHFEIFPGDPTRCKSILLKGKRQNPGPLFVGGPFANSLPPAEAAQGVGFTPKGFAFSSRPHRPRVATGRGKDAEGAVGAADWLPTFAYKDPVLGSAQAFADAIQKKYGHPADYVQAAGAAGVVAQQAAIETLGLAPPLSEKDREALMEQLHKQDVSTLYGHVKIGADGGNVQKPTDAGQIQGGQFALEYPAGVSWEYGGD